MLELYPQYPDKKENTYHLPNPSPNFSLFLFCREYVSQDRTGYAVGTGNAELWEVLSSHCISHALTRSSALGLLTPGQASGASTSGNVGGRHRTGEGMWQIVPELLQVATPKCHVASYLQFIGQHKSHLLLTSRS